MKKILSLVIAFVFLFMFILQTPAYMYSEIFTDLKGDEYYIEEAEYLYEQGIIGGYEDGSLRPNQVVTRAEMAAFICRLLGAEKIANKYKGTTTELTKDVSANHWASGYVAYAVKKGIINGDGNGKFRPNDKVKYLEVFKMLVCALGLEDRVVEVPGDWAAGYKKVAIEVGLNSDMLYEGGEYSNRSDVVMMLYNAITRVSFEKDVPEEPKKEETKEKTEGQKILEELEKYENRYDENGNLIMYSLKVTMSGCGGIVNTSGKYDAGANVPLYVYPGTESGFIRWTTTGGTIINPESTTAVLTMPDEDVVVCAEFADEGVVVREYDSEDDYWYPLGQKGSNSQNSNDDYSYSEADDNTFEETATLENFADEVVRLVNAERRKHGLNSLTNDMFLTEIAYAHSCDMRDRDFFSHENPDGKTVADRMNEAGIYNRIHAENIARGQMTPESVMEAWMNSPGHRENILREGLRYIGVGVCDSKYGYIWTQCFCG